MSDIPSLEDLTCDIPAVGENPDVNVEPDVNVDRLLEDGTFTASLDASATYADENGSLGAESSTDVAGVATQDTLDLAAATDSGAWGHTDDGGGTLDASGALDGVAGAEGADLAGTLDGTAASGEHSLGLDGALDGAIAPPAAETPAGLDTGLEGLLACVEEFVAGILDRIPL